MPSHANDVMVPSSCVTKVEPPTKLAAVVMPSPGIRKLEVQTGPVCPVLSSSHIVADRSNHSHNDLWTKLLQCSTEKIFAG